MIENSKPVRQRQPSKAECKRDWSTGSLNSTKGNGRRIIYQNQLIFTIAGTIVGRVTASGLVSGHNGLRVHRLPSGNWCQNGYNWEK